MKTKILILLMAALALGACAKKKGASSSRAVRGGSAVTPNTYGGNYSACPANMWGIVYDRQTNGQQFTMRLIDFTGNQDIGYVESNPGGAGGVMNTGVDLQMNARFINGQFDTANSRITIRIIDDRAMTYGQLQDIPMVGQAGQMMGPGQFNATFKDEYGTLIFQGQKDMAQNMIGGTVYYQNNGMPQQILGQFWINACSVVGI